MSLAFLMQDSPVVDLDRISEQSHGPAMAVRQTFIIFGALAGATLLAVGLTFLFWKRRRRRHRHRHHWLSPHPASVRANDSGHQTRRRRRSNRPNPTLAEAGGLPPIRDDSPHRPPH
jgi:hypothetical protein